MKNLFFVLLAVALTACAAPATPAAQPVAPEPVVVTVVVEPTQAPAQPEPIVVTVVVPASPVAEQPAAVPPTQPPAAAPNDSGNTSIVVDDLLGKGVFNTITLSSNEFSLRCVTRELTITATASLADITEAELFYRMVDQPKALYYSEWRSAGKMKDEGNGVFSYLLTGETIHPDLRLDLGWFEFQLVGLNKGGGVIDRTQKIEQLITYRIDCP
jgi:hypothetical protein